MPFSGVSPEARNSFRQRFEIDRAEIAGIGEFEDVTIDDVPVGPANERDARDWALARLMDLLARESRHRSRSGLRGQFADLVEGTPLEPWNPELPAHEKLLDRFASQPEHFWRIAAAVDLAPLPPNASELAGFRPGQVEPVPTAPTPGRDKPKLLRIPHGAVTSMARIVSQLLGDVKPVRVLLCDRYVRGESNLSSLGLFVDAIRAQAPQAQVDVATASADGQPIPEKRIREITGGDVIAFENLFGSDRHRWLHGRYVVLQTHPKSSSGGVGWDMTNSVLDSRPVAPSPSINPETPLKWRDITAVKLDSGEIPQDLARWLTR